jgi:hypothetical protein
MGMLAAFALYVLSVRLIEQRLPDELGLARLAPELAAGIAVGAALLSAMMGVLLVTGAYAVSGPTAAAPWQALTGSLEGTGGGTEHMAGHCADSSRIRAITGASLTACDFLHDLDLEITLGNELLQPRILDLELLQAPDLAQLPKRLRSRH